MTLKYLSLGLLSVSVAFAVGPEQLTDTDIVFPNDRTSEVERVMFVIAAAKVWPIYQRNIPMYKYSDHFDEYVNARWQYTLWQLKGVSPQQLANIKSLRDALHSWNYKRHMIIHNQAGGGGAYYIMAYEESMNVERHISRFALQIIKQVPIASLTRDTTAEAVLLATINRIPKPIPLCPSGDLNSSQLQLPASKIKLLNQTKIVHDALSRFPASSVKPIHAYLQSSAEEL